MQKAELFHLRFHPLGTRGHPIALCFVNQVQGIVRVSSNKIVGCIAFDTALHEL